MNPKEILVNSDFFEEIDTPIFIKNNFGVYEFCNEAFLRFIGKSSAQVLGKTAFDIAPQELANIYAKADRELFESASSQVYLSKVNTGQDGEKKVVFSKYLIRDEAHRILGFIGAIDSSINLIPKVCINRYRLTDREEDVLNLLIEGKAVKEIAKILHVSNYTISDHLKAIYVKLDVHSKGEAIYKALALLKG